MQLKGVIKCSRKTSRHTYAAVHRLSLESAPFKMHEIDQQGLRITNVLVAGESDTGAAAFLTPSTTSKIWCFSHDSSLGLAAASQHSRHSLIGLAQDNLCARFIGFRVSELANLCGHLATNMFYKYHWGIYCFEQTWGSIAKAVTEAMAHINEDTYGRGNMICWQIDIQ